MNSVKAEHPPRTRTRTLQQTTLQRTTTTTAVAATVTAAVTVMTEATAVAAARLKRANRNVEMTLPGGKLSIEWRERDDHVLMTGTADFEYEGRFDPALFADVA